MAILGILTVFITYLLVKELFNKNVALLSSFFLAICPWHLYNSRIAFNANLLPFLYTLSLLFLLKGIKGNKKFLVLSAIPFGISFYTYALSFCWIPLVLLSIFIIFRKKIILCKKEIIISLLLLLIISSPIILFYLKNQFHLININKILIFSLSTLTVPHFNQVTVFNTSQPFFYAIRSYSSHFSFSFLFFNSRILSIRGFGLLYLFQLPLILIGLFYCIKTSRKPSSQFLIIWLITFPIPVSFTTFDIPHPLRTINALPLFSILTALGIFYLFKKIKGTSNLSIKRALFITLSLFLIATPLNIGLFLHKYFRIPLSHDLVYMQYGIKESIECIKNIQTKYDKIVITDKINQPYIYVLFFTKYDPIRFQSENVKKITTLGGWTGVKAFNKYIFTDIEKYPPSKNSLYLGGTNELINKEIKKNIYYPNGKVVFKIAE
mgnify:CR=1 FL=1